MRITFNYMSLFLLMTSCCAITGCKDDTGIKVEKISVMQAEYDPIEKELVINLKDNQALQLVPLIFPYEADKKDVTYENENHTLMEASSSGIHCLAAMTERIICR